jgi:hypothetical protein
MLAAQLHHRHACIRFLQESNNLFFTDRFFMVRSLFKNRTLLRHEANERGRSALSTSGLDTASSARIKAADKAEKEGKADLAGRIRGFQFGDLRATVVTVRPSHYS